VAAAVACAVGAAALRPWFAVLPPALARAYFLPRASWRALATWPRPLALALLGGIVVTGIGGISASLERALEDPGAVVRGGLAGAAAAAVGAGAVPWILAWAHAGSARRDPLAALLVSAGPALAIAAGVAAAAHEPRSSLDERPLIALVPLVFALACQRLPQARSLLLSGATLAVMLPALSRPEANPALADAPGLALAWRLAGSRAVPAVVLALACLALTAVLARTRAHQLAWAGAAAAVAAGHVAAWDAARAASAAAGRAALVPAGWLDARVPDGATVPFVVSGPAPPRRALEQLALTNRSLGSLVRVDPARVDPSSGAISADAPDGLALASGLELAGTALAAGPLGALVRLEQPLRVAYVLQGVYPDSWTGDLAVYRRIGGSGPGTVVVTLSRRAWTGPDVPGAVAVRLGRPGARGTVVGRTVLHSGGERLLRIAVPAPPFDVLVTVRPTFSPAEFGRDDSRRLGAQVAFAYTPA
jgi:hypothetical protein